MGGACQFGQGTAALAQAIEQRTALRPRLQRSEQDSSIKVAAAGDDLRRFRTAAGFVFDSRQQRRQVLGRMAGAQSQRPQVGAARRRRAGGRCASTCTLMKPHGPSIQAWPRRLADQNRQVLDAVVGVAVARSEWAAWRVGRFRRRGRCSQSPARASAEAFAVALTHAVVAKLAGADGLHTTGCAYTSGRSCAAPLRCRGQLPAQRHDLVHVEDEVAAVMSAILDMLDQGAGLPSSSSRISTSPGW